jgi:hypothetical protein
MILSTTLLLAACGTPATTPPVAYTAEDVSHVVALSKMEGHLRVSLLLWEAGNYELAATHALHPAEELFPIVENELKAKNSDASLRSALDAYSSLAVQAGDESAVKAAHQAALENVQAAEQALVGPWMNDVVFQAKVIHGLLEGVEEEYTESFSNGAVTSVVPYQEGLGFFLTARSRYEAIEATIKSAHPKEHEEIEEQFEELEKAFPGVTPPAQVVDPEEVETHVDELAAELNEATGMKAEAAQSPVETIAAIRTKLADVLKEYKEGQTDEAYELAASAYLDGFEKIEADLLAKDGKELMETLETQFKDLRDGVKAGKPLPELEQLVGEINANLDKAEALLK